MKSTPKASEPGFNPGCSVVLFDGSCPLCSREIAMYRKLPADAPIAWIDISPPDFEPPFGATREGLMLRFHVIAPNGEILSGARAFVHLWSQLPRWRYLARLAKLPMAMSLMDIFYRLFLSIRPCMQSAYRLMQGPTQ